MAIIGIIQLNIIIIISNLFFMAFFLFYCESFIKTQELKENKYYGHLETMPPLGSIIPWIGAKNAGMDVPTRWQKCDGSLIEQGPLAGQTTPNLNEKELFIRGGGDKDSGRIEDDALEEHSHKDPGHTHKDRGHTHTQEEHSHQIDESGLFNVPLEILNYCIMQIVVVKLGVSTGIRKLQNPLQTSTLPRHQ